MPGAAPALARARRLVGADRRGRVARAPLRFQGHKGSRLTAAVNERAFQRRTGARLTAAVNETALRARFGGGTGHGPRARSRAAGTGADGRGHVGAGVSNLGGVRRLALALLLIAPMAVRAADPADAEKHRRSARLSPHWAPDLPGWKLTLSRTRLRLAAANPSLLSKVTALGFAGARCARRSIREVGTRRQL